MYVGMDICMYVCMCVCIGNRFIPISFIETTNKDTMKCVACKKYKRHEIKN